MSMNDEFEFQEAMGEVRVRRMPSGGISAVLAVLLPGLGHVDAGRLAAGGGRDLVCGNHVCVLGDSRAGLFSSCAE